MDNIRYLYEVRPRTPVRIPGKRATMMRQTIQLTKSEVKEYMKHGPVYRKSATGEMIQVTGDTLDKLHGPFPGEQSKTVTSKPVENPNSQKPANNQQYSNNQQQNWQGKKDKNKHGKGNNNYHGDERGKTAANNNSPNPQLGSESPQQSQDTPTVPIVNIP